MSPLWVILNIFHVSILGMSWQGVSSWDMCPDVWLFWYQFRLCWGKSCLFTLCFDWAASERYDCTTYNGDDVRESISELKRTHQPNVVVFSKYVLNLIRCCVFMNPYSQSVDLILLISRQECRYFAVSTCLGHTTLWQPWLCVFWPSSIDYHQTFSHSLVT